MRAARFYNPGKPLSIEEIEVPKPGNDEALVRVRACGVCHTDTLFLSGFKKPGKSPITLGHEIAGDVVEIGRDVKNINIGDRAIVYFYIPCTRCEFCRSGQESLCTNTFGRIGFDFDGGYAEFVRVPAQNVLPLPEKLEYQDGAVLADAASSAFHAVYTIAGTTVGDKLAIVGTGGLGLYALQWAKLGGAHVVGIDLDEKKLTMASELGAVATINARDKDPSKALKGIFQQGADIVLDFVGTSQSMHDDIEMVGRGGRLVLVGYSEQNLNISPATIVSEGLSILGSRACSRLEVQKTIDAAARGLIRSAVTRVFRLEDVNHALDDLIHGKTVGRSVVSP